MTGFERVLIAGLLALLVGCVFLAAALTWLLPAGQYERREDSATGRSVVIAGTYVRAPQRPLGPMAAATAIPKGIVDAAPVIALILLIGGGFNVRLRYELGRPIVLPSKPGEAISVVESEESTVCSDNTAHVLAAVTFDSAGRELGRSEAVPSEAAPSMIGAKRSKSPERP